MTAALSVVLVATTTGHAVPCPTTVTFEGATVSDVGFSGVGHAVDTGALALPLAVSNCAGTESGACGSCDVSGPLVASDGRNRRCRGDLSTQCTTDASCGAAGPCRTYAGPPGPIEAGGVEICVVPEISGSITGTVEPDAGALSLAVPIEMRVIRLVGLYSGGPIPPFYNPSYRPCPTCEGGTCQGGRRNGLPCQVDAFNGVYGDTSFDCPSDQDPTFLYTPLFAAVVPLSTGTQTVALGPESPNCWGAGTVPPGKCYCDTCNNQAHTPCMSNADCVAVGATICGGKRCIKAGNPCVTNGDCHEVGDLCGRPGDPTRPYGCVPPDGDLPDGCLEPGICADGPVSEHCAAPEEHRFCNTAYASETCPLTSSCSEARLRRCHHDDGSGVAVVGAANPPVEGLASAAIGALFCSNVSVSALNNALGFPGLIRMRSEGSLTFGDAAPIAAPTPQPTATATPLPTPVPGGCPGTVSGSCRAAGTRGAKLQISRAGDLVKRTLKWQWKKGPATTAADIGDPVTTAYELCVYDQGELVVSVPVAAGGTCSGKPCWRASASGKITFRNKDVSAQAATRVDLKPGDGGRSTVAFAAAGPYFFAPNLGTLAGPLDVQLHSGNGVCWGATFAAPFDELDVEKGTLRDRN